MDNRSELGDRLRELRELKNMSLDAVCKQTGFQVKRESLLRLEEGRTDPSKLNAKTMLALLDFYYPELDLNLFTSDYKDLRIVKENE